MRGSGRIDGSVRNLLFVGGRQTRLRTLPVHGLFHVFSSFSTPPTSSDFQRFSRFPLFSCRPSDPCPLYERNEALEARASSLFFQKAMGENTVRWNPPEREPTASERHAPFRGASRFGGRPNNEDASPGARGPRRGTRLLSYSRRPTCACGRLVTLADAENDLGGATPFRPFLARAMSGGSGGFDSHEVHY